MAVGTAMPAHCTARWRRARRHAAPGGAALRAVPV